MMIEVTFAEINNSGHWNEFCKMHGINPWCMNEGLANSHTTRKISVDEAKRYGLLNDDTKPTVANSQ